MNRAPLSPASALVAHAESLLSGGRVLVVGNAENCLAEHLLERGARLVQVLDPDPRRVAHAAAHNGERRVTFAQLNETSFRDSAFDCALVEDLALASHPSELVQGLRRALGHQGVALIACSSDDSSSGLLGSRKGALRFSAFSETVHAAFERVLLVAQTPFVGYAVVHLDFEGPPEPALDNGFLTGGADAADFYIAVAGRSEAIEGLELEDMTIVQLPARQALSDGNLAQRSFEQRANRRIETLENEVRELGARGGSEEIERLTGELEKRDTWIRQLESRAESADARADDAEAELERLDDELKAQSGASEELERLRERVDDAERVAERCQKEHKWADERVKKLERELEALLREAEKGPSAEMAGLERGLSIERTRADALGEQLAAKHQLLEKLEARTREQERELRELGKHLADAEDRLTASDEARLLAEQSLNSESERRALAERQSQANEEKARELATTVTNIALETPDELEREVRGLEEQLEERGRAVATLERELGRLEGYAKTLVAELALGGGSSGAAQDDLQREFDALAQSLAEREADLLAASWTIGSLQKRLGAASIES